MSQSFGGHCVDDASDRELAIMMESVTTHDPMEERSILFNAIDTLSQCQDLLLFGSNRAGSYGNTATEADILNLRALACRYKQAYNTGKLLLDEDENKMLDEVLACGDPCSFLEKMMVFCKYLKSEIQKGDAVQEEKQENQEMQEMQEDESEEQSEEQSEEEQSEEEESEEESEQSEDESEQSEDQSEEQSEDESEQNEEQSEEEQSEQIEEESEQIEEESEEESEEEQSEEEQSEEEDHMQM